MANLNIADMRTKNVQNRFRALKRKRTNCTSCGRRTMVSVRLKICQTCFHGEVLSAKEDIHALWGYDLD